MTPNLHVGKHTGSKAFVQTSTGAIVEIPQPNLPIKNAKSGLTVWDEIIK
jgi:type IV pilus assembly protein PilY1